ncbi:MAG: hypothetical protein R3E12_01120 [Candidatus Eisenbacteria bacterium]
MLHDTKARTVSMFLQSEFSRVSAKVASEILDAAKVKDRTVPATSRATTRSGCTGPGRSQDHGPAHELHLADRGELL